ncbi:hypothetical protein BDZ89DRAFT_1141534 [Hymenopellis radicata]|nr:hypothetical protein BDZ89DRAFT_1141534 [Hymenopellis radicata]
MHMKGDSRITSTGYISTPIEKPSGLNSYPRGKLSVLKKKSPSYSDLSQANNTTRNDQGNDIANLYYETDTEPAESQDSPELASRMEMDDETSSDIDDEVVPVRRPKTP